MGQKPRIKTEGPSPDALQAFEDYYALGPTRSLEKLINHYRASGVTKPSLRLPTVREWSSKYRWQQQLIDRTIADIARKQELDRKQEEDDRKIQREIRRGLIKAANRKATDMLVLMEVNAKTLPKWAEAVALLKLVLDEGRKEYNDQPTQRIALETMSNEQLLDYLKTGGENSGNNDHGGE